MAMSVPKVMSDNQPKIQKAQRTSGNRNAKKKLYWVISFLNYRKSQKKKKKNLKKARGGKNSLHIKEQK